MRTGAGGASRRTLGVKLPIAIVAQRSRVSHIFEMTDLVECSSTLVHQRLEALYRCDPRGRMVTVNEWDGRAAPRFHLMRTAQESIARYRTDLADDLVARLEQLRVQEQVGRQSGKLPALCSKYLELLSSHAPIIRVWAGPVFVFPANVVTLVHTVSITGTNEHLLRGGFDDWLQDLRHRQPFIAVVENNRAISICASVRISGSIHCAGVETLVEHRKRGHAANVVARWALAVRALGATPFYSTSWENQPSQRVAARLHLNNVGIDFHVS